MIYKISVDKQPRDNPSSDKREYQVNIEELRRKGEIYDSLIITTDEDYVMRRLELTEYHVLKVLPSPIKQNIPELNIELFEGDNYIYLSDLDGNNFYAEYILKNDLTDTFVSNATLTSTINQTARQIEISVGQTLENYSTTTEMNAAINVKADEISSVVSTKVGQNEVISKINQSAEQIQINANKISLEGKAINLTSDDITIDSTNFKLTKDGNMTCKNANITGTISSNNATITGGSITVYDGTKNNPKLEAKKTGDVNIRGYITPSEFNIGGNDQYINYSSGNFSAYCGSNNTLSMLKNGKTTFNTSDFYVIGDVHAKSYLYDSLESYKKNIVPYKENVLNIIKNSDLYMFNYKKEEENHKKHIGFVIGNNYNTPQILISNSENGIDAYSMSSVLWLAVQQLQNEIEELQNEIKLLKEEKQNG